MIIDRRHLIKIVRLVPYSSLIWIEHTIAMILIERCSSQRRGQCNQLHIFVRKIHLLGKPLPIVTLVLNLVAPRRPFLKPREGLRAGRRFLVVIRMRLAIENCDIVIKVGLSLLLP